LVYGTIIQIGIKVLKKYILSLLIVQWSIFIFLHSAANKNYLFKLDRASSLGTATVPTAKTATGMGPIGMLTNGVPIYNMVRNLI